MKALSKKDKDTLNAIPLIDIMQAWGYTPHTVAKNGQWALYLCPWHNDHHPSLLVDLNRRGDNPDLGFKCLTCKECGFGAIQLAARLMGKPSAQLSAADFKEVITELLSRCNIHLEGTDTIVKGNAGVSFLSIDKFKQANPQYADWDGKEALFERAEWTLEAIRTLGFRIELAQRRARKTDVTPETDDSPEVKNGDLLTRYDADTGLPLYRCSLGRDFYRGASKAELRSLADWGHELELIFGVEPVSRFIRWETPDKGGACAMIITAALASPIFMFNYPFGVKKYEPRTSIKDMKWTWWNLTEDADLDHRYFADQGLTDALEGVIPAEDKRHPYIVTEKANDGSPLKVCFRRVVLCSGPRDAMQVYAHSDAHVVWLLSETSGLERRGGAMRPDRWLRALIKQLRDVTLPGGLYVCYDEDPVGLQASQAIALADPQVRWLRLPKELASVPVPSYFPQGKRYKDVTDFVSHFSQVEALMPADLQHDDPADWFDNALFDTPTCQFWQWESERKDADGTGRARYKFDLRNVPVFLRARGMVRKVAQQGKSSFSRFFLLGNDNTYVECFPGEKGANRLVGQARDLMAEWLRAHKQHNDEKGALSRAIYAAKLEQGTIETIEECDFDDHSYAEDYDHFFFENTACRVDKNGITLIPYSRMPWWTNREAILDGKFSIVEQPWRIIRNPDYPIELEKHEAILADMHTAEEKAQDNMRFDAWASLWKYRLIMGRPFDEMPLHFKFLYNTGRILWEDENIRQLSPAERQMQDMYFIAAAHAIGSALVRNRTSSRQQYVHITDNGTRREDYASGGTGKTAILELLSLVRRVLKIDGKSLEGGNITLTQELAKVIPGLHNIVAIDELPQGFSPKTLYNLTLSLTARGLYRDSMVIEGDDLPKFVVASNEQLDLSSDSTNRRTYQLLVSDYYHPRSIDGSRPAHTPADDFRNYRIKEVARNLPPSLLNEARNMLLACVQFFFQEPEETIRPPKDNRALLRQALAASKDEQFTRWAASYIGDRRHRGIPIAQRELAISLLDYCGITVGEKTLRSAYRRLRENLPEYIRVSPYVMNPPVVLSTPTDREDGFRRCAAWQYPRRQDGSIATDASGNRLPRELIKKSPYSRVYYFYAKNAVPRHFFSPDHIGDKDYVQPAPENDPDAIDNE